jgi:hypothetical protein
MTVCILPGVEKAEGSSFLFFLFYPNHARHARVFQVAELKGSPGVQAMTRLHGRRRAPKSLPEWFRCQAIGERRMLA